MSASLSSILTQRVVADVECSPDSLFLPSISVVNAGHKSFFYRTTPLLVSIFSTCNVVTRDRCKKNVDVRILKT